MNRFIHLTSFRVHTRVKGLVVNTILALAALLLIYGNLLPRLNHVYFAKDGDGLQMYANTIYHITWSNSLLRSDFMNYPYGEHVVFSNSMLISNGIKILKQAGIDLSGYSVGIINGLLLFSILMGSIFLFLILHELEVHWIVSAVAATGIAFLSPQLDRFGGHLNLGYVCAIPWFIYLLMRFFRSPGWCLSFLLALTGLAAALVHFYLFCFYSILVVFFYAGFALAAKKVFMRKSSWFIHFFIQLILPYLFFRLLMLTDTVGDRPSYPWGFLVYRAFPESIFLPLGKPYGLFLNRIISTGHIDWEAYAYIGLVGVFTTLIVFGMALKSFIQKGISGLWNFIPDARMNILVWAAFMALLYSFGIPFIFGMEKLADHIGPLRQMRSIARFSWIFYYVINITAFYLLWQYYKNRARKILPLIVLLVCLVFLFYDSWIWSRNRGNMLANEIPELQDTRNQAPGNQWINRIEPSSFQAILPVPYFHVGSENIWIDGGCGILPKTMITGVQTGLPSMGVFLSRTSLEQTWNNISLMLEPSLYSASHTFFPSQKPLLLIAARCNEVDDNEKRLIHRAVWIDSMPGFDVYQLPVHAFSSIYDSLAGAAWDEYQSGKLIKQGNLWTNDPVPGVRFLDYDSLSIGEGCLTGTAEKGIVLYNDHIPCVDTSVCYLASVWIKNIRKDLVPRTQYQMVEYDENDKIVDDRSDAIFRNVVSVDSSDALVEITFRMQHPDRRLEIRMINPELGKTYLEMDDLLIRPSGTDVFQLYTGGIKKNNRFYPEKRSR
jgi:hypothetical protein